MLPKALADDKLELLPIHLVQRREAATFGV
jgi:hypothetical protein